ncbi:enoyl-CoA hydratase [Kineosphaera limosa]|nr:enoyl-CoA hydratase [Kineosphaera limosa]NYE01860.1 enoyl-CoA hydratase [Kineosphaera limosa]
MTTNDDPVLVQRDGGVLRITINRPEALNACTTSMLRTIEGALNAHDRDPQVRVAVLTGAGRGFCSGADIGGKDGDLPTVDTLDAANAAIAAIRRFPRPVLALTRGPVAGVGVSLAIACDLVLAGEDAFFLLAFSKIGLMPDGGATALVAASIGRARAMRMALLAEKVTATQAHEWGLISHVVPVTDYEQAAADLVEALAAGPSLGYRAAKDAINDATLTELENAWRRERQGQGDLLLTADFAEGQAAFQHRRPPTFTGS